MMVQIGARRPGACRYAGTAADSFRACDRSVTDGEPSSVLRHGAAARQGGPSVKHVQRRRLMPNPPGIPRCASTVAGTASPTWPAATSTCRSSRPLPRCRRAPQMPPAPTRARDLAPKPRSVPSAQGSDKIAEACRTAGSGPRPATPRGRGHSTRRATHPEAEGRRGEGSPAAGQPGTRPRPSRPSRATARADAAHQAARRIPEAGTPRSRGAGVAEQMSQAAPEPGLIQARVILPLPRLLTAVSTPGRITPLPRRSPGRLQLLQPLPLLRRDQHDQLVTRTADCDRPRPASTSSAAAAS